MQSRRHAHLTLALSLTLSLAWCTRSSATDDGHWVQISTAHTPGSRSSAAAAYDANGKRVLLFGGYAAGNKNDVWQLSLGCTPDWTQISTSGTPPAARTNATAVYDPVHNQLVVYGGSAGATYYGDVWVLSLGASPTWTRVDSAAASGCATTGKPCKRVDHGAVWDSYAGKMWISCGVSCFTYQDTWAAAVTGSSSSWSLVAGDGECDRVYHDTSLPEPRSGLSMIYDARNQGVVVYGGDYEGQQAASTAWASDPSGASWTELATPPSPDRMEHTAVYDSSRARMLVYGGVSSDGVTQNDSTIVLSLPLGGSPSWSTLHPTGSTPGNMSDHSSAYDADGDRMIIFGTNGNTYALNFDASGPNNSTLSLVFHGSNLFLRWTAPGEDGASGQALCYDLRTSDSSINSGNFSSATPMSAPNPSVAGAKDSVNISGLADGTTHYFALKTIDHHGNISAMSNVVSICLTLNPMHYCDGEALRNPEVVRNELTIDQLYPNPARQDLRVAFTLPRDGDARIELLDVAGRRIRTIDIGALGAGRHEINLAEGGPLPGGMFFVRLRQGDLSVARGAIVVH